jgi:exodeoxyribonuclease X
MNAITLDTETHKLHGLPVQISYMPCAFNHLGNVVSDMDAIFDQFYSVGEPIDFAAMAVHHIIDEDLIGKPRYDTFKMPESVEYVIGHNIHYDLAVIAKCGVDVGHLKPICTLAIARAVFPHFKSHTLSALIYALAEFKSFARRGLKFSHNARADVINTTELLKHLIYELRKTQKIQCFEDLYLYTQSVIIPTHIVFGEYKGTALNELPADYVCRLLKKPDLDPFLRIGLEKRKVH